MGGQKRVRKRSLGLFYHIFLLLWKGRGVVLVTSMHCCTSQKSKVDIHLIINRWKSFRQHWRFVNYLIWDSKDTSLHGIIKDLGQLILEKDWIGPL